jgi:putative oxidoreductase
MYLAAVSTTAPVDLALLVVRVVFGIFFAVHGINKVRGGLRGTAGWFESVGMRWPLWQARVAASTEIVAGSLLAVGLLTPFAAAGMIGVMVVAIRVAHWNTGFFIFNEGQGWEYCASIAVMAWAVATIGPGRWSVDHALDLQLSGAWSGALIAAALGVGGAVGQLALSYRAPTEENS